MIFTGLSKVVLIGGSTKRNGVKLNSVEVIDLSGDGKSCPELPEYPLSVTHLTATFLNNTILACGGFYRTEKCFQLTSDKLSEWVEIASMVEPLSSLSSSNIDGQWFLTGGLDTTGSGVYVTQTYDGASFINGKRLPNDKYSHCQVTVDPDNVLLTGGNGQNTYLYNWSGQTYNVVEPIPMSLEYGACGFLNNPMKGPEVLVAEGFDCYIYSVSSDSWRDGPPLPESILDFSTARIDEGILAIGGSVSGTTITKVYLFEEESYEWKLLEQEIVVPRTGASAVAVPDDFINCQ